MPNKTEQHPQSPWTRLINDMRFGLEHYHDPKHSALRSDFRRDYDRLVFSSPFRRLQNKTQVFPLPGSIFVHNRLTHSLEVSSVGKSLADAVSDALQQKAAATGAGTAVTAALGHLGDIVSAACLAHDLGNPPFGHSGEKAISAYFSEGNGARLKPLLTPHQWSDLVNFEGNANTLRVLTHNFKGRRNGGFAMTYSTLAAIIKYPYASVLAGDKGKFGFLESETRTFVKIARTLGMVRLSNPGDPAIRYARHPLVYIVEAADDICYEVMDLEDAHKLKILSTQIVIDTLKAYFDPGRLAKMQPVLDSVDDPNEKIAYLRSCVIGRLVDCCATVFIENEQQLLDGTFEGRLLDHIPDRERRAYLASSDLSWNRIYCAREVVDIELAGNRIITFLLDKLVGAVLDPGLNYSKLLLSQVPEQYDVHAPDLYARILAVLDHVSAMTDVYALDLYRKLNGMSLPAV